MSFETTTSPSPPIVLHMGSVLTRLSDSEFYEFCQLNRDWRIERTENGDLVIMPPTGGNTGRRNLSLTTQLGIWCEQDGTGIGFDSSTGFQLPNGAKRSQDASWVRRDRWDALSAQEQEEFPPLTPDFVVELRSKTDSVDDLEAKMREYVANGARLGWLIDPYLRRVMVYRPDQEPTAVEDMRALSGDPELPGFVLDLVRIW
jgi:Uma2 family endonuclease